MWGIRSKGGKSSCRELQPADGTCFMMEKPLRVQRCGIQIVKQRSLTQSQDHSESNTNQSVTDVKLIITGHNLSANHLKSENFMFQLCKNILIKATLTPGFLFPKTRLYFPLCPEDSKHLQKGKPSSLVRRHLPSKSFCAYEASPRSNRRKPRRGGGGGGMTLSDRVSECWS